MRSVVLAAIVVLFALIGAGCALIPTQDSAPVPPGPLGPIVPAVGGGPPIECRGVPLEQCRSFGNSGDADTVRYIITCTTVCTPEKGDVRIDILGSDGTTRSNGNGAYASGGGVPGPIPAVSGSSTT